ncbi:hypothetical protein [Litorihabitans aurantiacus]|uniref:Uncharacterized protein n=1 Tax=Litorihabitans aurantiacus TaxID=1930061 RepID=A0AA37UMK2_9MICO|nr:hypothetical protein [Litorihabitans aurantiacus]GMA30709.1 hypothetical protein GCM10025875_07010 [Litorihabitans aurantiacus]
MVRRITGIVVALLGITAIVLGVLSATQWRTSDTVTATSPSADVPFVVVEPGVAGVNAPDVDVRITAADPEQQVTLITGRDVDVDAWLDGLAQQRLTDVVDWETFVVTDVEGESADVPSPVGSDMWTTTEQAAGELAFSQEVAQDRQVMLVVRDGAEGPAPTVSFTWQREVTTPYYEPLVYGGAAGVVVGLALIAWSFVKRRRPAAETAGEPEAAAAAAESGDDGDATAPVAPDGAEGVAVDDAPTTVLGAVPAAIATESDSHDPPTAETAVLTRRQRRELRNSGVEVDGPGAYDGLRERLAAVDVERIASDIAPAQEKSPPTDAPDAYPGWLRAQQAAETDGDGESEVDGDRTGTAVGETGAEPEGQPVRPTWSQRWGVATTGSIPVTVAGEPSDGGTPEEPSDGETPVDPTDAGDTADDTADDTGDVATPPDPDDADQTNETQEDDR